MAGNPSNGSAGMDSIAIPYGPATAGPRVNETLKGFIRAGTASGNRKAICTCVFIYQEFQ